MVASLPDLLSSGVFSRVTSKIRSDLNTAALEAVTGRRDDLTSAAKGQTGQVHRAQTVVDLARAAQTRLALATGRYTQAATALESVRTLTENMGSEALQVATSGDATGIATSAQSAEGAIKSAFQLLNTRFDGRALFAGDQADVGAVGDPQSMIDAAKAIAGSGGSIEDRLAQIDDYFSDGGTFDTSVYIGGRGEAAPVTLSNGLRLDPITTANSGAMRDLMKGMVIVAASIELPPQEIVAWVRQGASLIRTAQDSLVIEEAALGTSLNRLSEADQQTEREVLTAQAKMDRVIGRDPFEAASEIQDLETRLQAAYTLTSRISNLSLVNFLR